MNTPDGLPNRVHIPYCVVGDAPHWSYDSVLEHPLGNGGMTGVQLHARADETGEEDPQKTLSHCHPCVNPSRRTRQLLLVCRVCAYYRESPDAARHSTKIMMS